MLLPNRIIALALAGFCLLSAGRGLVPGLCLELGDVLTARLLEPAAASCETIGPARACCSPKAAQEGAPAPEKSRAKCPFCEMAKALIEVPEPFEAVFLPDAPLGTFIEPLRPQCRPRMAQARNRAPPASLAFLA